MFRVETTGKPWMPRGDATGPMASMHAPKEANGVAPPKPDAKPPAMPSAPQPSTSSATLASTASSASVNKASNNDFDDEFDDLFNDTSDLKVSSIGEASPKPARGMQLGKPNSNGLAAAKPKASLKLEKPAPASAERFL